MSFVTFTYFTCLLLLNEKIHDDPLDLSQDLSRTTQFEILLQYWYHFL